MLVAQVARGCSNTYLEKLTCNIGKVLLFRRAETRDSNLTFTRSAHIDRVLEWLDSLRRQLKYVTTPSQGPSMRAALPHASLVIRWQLLVESRADSLWAADMRRFRRLHTEAAALALSDAAQLAIMFGYLPPLRLACVRTLLHPDYVDVPGPEGVYCTDPECK